MRRISLKSQPDRVSGAGKATGRWSRDTEAGPFANDHYCKKNTGFVVRNTNIHTYKFL